MKKKFRGEHSSNTSSILRTITTATSSVSIGQAVVSDGYHIKLATSSNLANVLIHTGIATSAGAAGSEISVIHHGLVDPTIFNLGDGYICAVGTDSSGNVVRVTDGSCVSGLKYLGMCDGYGTITVAPRTADNFNVLDFGAVGDGITDDTAAIRNIIAVAALVGGTIYFPATGSYYKVTSAIILPGNANLIGEFSQNDGVSNIGSVIAFQGIGSGFVMNGASITIKNLTLFTDSLAGPHISQPIAASAFGLWQIDNVRMSCGNPNEGAIVLGSGSSDGAGVENNWSTFSRVDILSAASQAVPVIQMYGQGGGLSNISIRDSVITGGGLVGSGSESTAEFIHVESTDSGIVVNIEFHNISFEIPVKGAIVFKSVSDSKITNCWAGDLTGHNPQAPCILIDRSSHTGALPSQNILIDTLFSDIGTSTPGQETVSVTFAGSGPVILLNSKIPSINNGGLGLNPIINVGSFITNILGDPVVGIDAAGFIHGRAQFIQQSSIILHNGLNSDISPNFYSGFAKTNTTAIEPILLGGLALGFYGNYDNEGIEFTLLHDYTQPLTIVHEDVSSTAAYRINTLSGEDIVVGLSAVIKFIYDNNSSRWLVTSVFNASNSLLTGFYQYTFSWTPGTILADGYATTTVAVTEAQAGDAIAIGCNIDLGAGVMLSGNMYTAGSCRVTIFNATTSPVTLGALTLRVVAID